MGHFMVQHQPRKRFSPEVADRAIQSSQYACSEAKRFAAKLLSARLRAIGGFGRQWSQGFEVTHRRPWTKHGPFGKGGL